MDIHKGESIDIMNTPNEITDTYVPLPTGFRAAGIHVGVKPPPTRDMALIVSDTDAAMAGTFTRNKVTAAPVKLCRERLLTGMGRAIVMNSGIANACTGQAGLAAARRMAAVTARALDVPEERVYVCSTGSIGKPMPIEIIEQGIPALVAAAAQDRGFEAALAMMTTDTRPKYVSTSLMVDGKGVTLTGLAKGAGMIEPNMATMLCYLMTDACVDADALQTCLRDGVNQSFNRVSVDGDQSTNDTVLFMANGLAKNTMLNPNHPDWAGFCAAVNAVTLELALKIAKDGEGATRFVTVLVKGAANDQEADIAARAVANSMLVKTSWAGSRVNWGRVMDALGYSGVRMDETQVDIFYGDVQAVRDGAASGVCAADIEAVALRDEFLLTIDLHQDAGEARVYTCNFTEEYVRINV
ncbi:MAG: bifunctional glutamate N-acetyltransferase/amino-acid acetyltransferase ArgJ [Spartobacteria bacterium]|nr:bifunctional glutamate N-acetyltransferase/amino-acid acetyltransferase ArgJ [Spartobacteria bacterium]